MNKGETIKRGDRIEYKPGHCEPGENDFVHTAIEDESGGRVLIETDIPNMNINPTAVCKVEWLRVVARGNESK